MDAQNNDLRKLFSGLNFQAIESSISTAYESYEFLFLLAILTCVKNRNLQANPLAPISLAKIATEMLVIGLYPVSNGVPLGNENKIKTHLSRIGILDSGSENVYSRIGQIRSSIQSRYRLSDDDVIRYLPSRFLLHFFPETAKDLGNALRDNKIAITSRSNFTITKPLYCLNPSASMLTLEEDWVIALVKHYDEMLRWLLKMWSASLPGKPPLSLLHPQGAVLASVRTFATVSASPIEPVDGRKTLVFGREQATRNDESLAVRGLEECRLFAGLDPLGGEVTLIRAAKSICESLQSIRKPPKSLCQISPSKADFVWLSRWAQNLDEQTTKHFLVTKPFHTRPNAFSLSNREIIGLMFLMLASETARREGKEGQVWPLFLSKFSETTASLMKINGELGPWVKRSVEQAVYSQGLRNVIGKTGIQYHYLTVFLQFGMTRNAIRRLPFYLSGHPVPEAVKYLLSEHSDVRSRTFQHLWEMLVGYRDERVGENEVRAFLENSTWILPEWTKEILVVARGSSYSGAHEFSDDFVLEEDLQVKQSLIWTYPDAPIFQLTLQPSTFEDLEDGAYQIRMSDQIKSTIMVTQGSTTKEASFSCSTEIPESSLDLIDINGEVIKTNETLLWDKNEDIHVFDLRTGAAVDPWMEKMLPQKGYAILSHDFLEPSFDIDFYAIPNLNRKLWLLPVGWNKSFQLLMDGSKFWSPLLFDRKEDFTLQRIRIIPSSSKVIVGDLIDIRISGLSNGATLKRVSIGGIQLNFEADGSNADCRNIVVVPAMIGSSGKAILWIEYKGSLWKLNRRLALETVSLSIWNGCSWEVPAKQLASLESREGIHRKFKFLTSGRLEKEKKSFYVFEAEQPVGPVKLSKSSLAGLSGYGGELKIRKLYNPQPLQDEFPLGIHVENRGIITAAMQTGSKLRIVLSKQCDVQNLNLVVWALQSEPKLLGSNELSLVGENTLEFALDITLEQCMLGLSSNGVRVGAFWPKTLAAYVTIQRQSSTASLIAAMLRWFRIPILRPQVIQTVRTLLKGAPVEFVSAWLSDIGLPKGLAHAEECNSWYSAIRSLNQGIVTFSVEQAYRLLESLDPTSEDALTTDDFSHCVRELLHMDPLIANAALVAWAEGTSRATVLEFTHASLTNLLSQPIEAESKDLDFAFEKLKQFTSEALRVDPNFVMTVIKAAEDSIAKPISERDFLNLQVGMSSDSFRRLLGARLMKNLKLIARS